MNNLFIDIETVPGCDWYIHQLQEAVAPPSNYRSDDAIQKWWKEIGDDKVVDAGHAAGLIPAYGEIVCISVAKNDEDPVSFTAYSEIDLLQDFRAWLKINMPELGQTRLIGHNLVAFDLPFLWFRSLYNKVNLSYWVPCPNKVRPWETERLFDTLHILAGRDTKGYSLGNMGKLFGIKDRYPEIDGSMIWDLYTQCKLNDITAYCENDVMMVRDLYKRMEGFT